MYLCWPKSLVQLTLVLTVLFLFRETALLVDPANSSSSSKQWVALVVGNVFNMHTVDISAEIIINSLLFIIINLKKLHSFLGHELAHQWFGNLVSV